MTRQAFLEAGAAAGAMMTPADGTASSRVDEEQFWIDVRDAFPTSLGLVNLVHTGGGACPTATLNLISQYQVIAAAGGEDSNPLLANLKESGSSSATREMMAAAFGCEADEIALTRNAMEGLAIGLLGIDLKPGDEVLTTRADYDACIQILRQRESRDGIRLKLIEVPMPASDDEEVVAAFEAACSLRTKLILMCHMYNKNGQVLPVRKVADMARGRGIATVVDGAQSVGQIGLRLSDLGCDVFATSLHKWFYGPRGTGFVYVRRDMVERVWPLWPSWSGKSAASVEKYEDYGTASKAVSAALPSVFEFNGRIGATKKEARLRYLRDLWLEPILESGRTTLLTDRHPARSCAISAFKVDGIEPERLARELRERHDILIGSIKLAYRPDFKGNYLAAGLTNTADQVERFADAFKSAVSAIG